MNKNIKLLKTKDLSQECRNFMRELNVVRAMVIDYIRPKVWSNSKVAYWYRQNILLFVHSSYFRTNHLLEEKLRNYVVKNSTSVSVIHPVSYLIKIGAINGEDNINKIDLSLPSILEINSPNKVKKESGIISKFKRIINYFQTKN